MYIVVDEMCGTKKEFKDLKEARQEAYNVQGILYEDDTILCDYSEF